MKRETKIIIVILLLASIASLIIILIELPSQLKKMKDCDEKGYGIKFNPLLKDGEKYDRFKRRLLF